MDNVITRLGSDDNAYGFEWVQGMQYWWENVHDSMYDRPTRGREIKMVDPFGRVDTLVVSEFAETDDIIALWRKLWKFASR
jgi:hypothetical protein